MKKILASDYDGTFYINDEDIKNNIKNIKDFRKNSNIFIIATGRSFFDFTMEIIEKNIKYDYLAINHGATILDENNQIIANYPIEEEIKKILIENLELNEEKNMFACKLLDGRASIQEEGITKINVKYDSLEKAIKMNNYLNNHYHDYITSYLLTTDTSIEIISSKVNKAEAIKKVAEIEKISFSNIYTIGDSYNDIEMIKAFNGNCMVESKQELLNICKKENHFSSVSNLIKVINK